MDKYLTELVGTFFLVFGIGMAVTSGTPVKRSSCSARAAVTRSATTRLDSPAPFPSSFSNGTGGTCRCMSIRSMSGPETRPR